MITLAAARRTRLNSVRIVDYDEFSQTFASKLEEYVPPVEYSPGVTLAGDGFESSGEED